MKNLWKSLNKEAKRQENTKTQTKSQTADTAAVEPTLKPDSKTEIKPEVKKDTKSSSSETKSEAISEVKQQSEPAAETKPATKAAEEVPETAIKPEPAKEPPKFNETNQNITAAEEDMFFETINQYNSGIRNIHFAESSGRPIKPEFKKDYENTMKKLDALFEKATPLEHEQVVYRGLGESKFHANSQNFNKIIENAKAGDIITPDAGYAYVSWDNNLVKQYAGKTTLKIHLPKGTKMIHHGKTFIPGTLGESVLQRNASYKVLNKESGADGHINLVLELIP